MELPETQQLLADLRAAGRAMGSLAQDDTKFRAALDAFRAADSDSFGRLLDELKIGLDCEVICRWFSSKECVLECLELCGPPPEEEFSIEDLPAYAEALVKITLDEELVERLAEAIEDQDKDEFQGLIKELDIERFCHLICHWVCGIRCRLRCEVVCSPVPIQRRHLVAELARSGRAVQSLLENRDRFDSAIKAALAFDCTLLSEAIDGIGGCEWICEWICSWRCMFVCLPLCREFPVQIENPIEEMREFAGITARLAATEGVVERFLGALQRNDAKLFGELVREFEIERFCIQWCHWLCYEICRRFCFCVCPPPGTIPMFTHVGMYRVDPIWNDFTADGTTTAGDFGFTGTIPLIGILPDGTAPDSLEYRFRTEKYPLGGGPNDVTAAMIQPTVIGQLEYWDWDATIPGWVLRSADYYANNAAVPDVVIHQPVPPDLTVTPNTIVKAGGWIEVPRWNELFVGGRGRFIPTGSLARLDTTKLTDETFDLTVAAPPLPLVAGDTVPALQRSEKPHFKIYFEARKVGGAAVSANNRDKIALSNTHYTFRRHPLWAGGTVTDVPVLSVDIVELIAGGGCVQLTTAAHVTFTAYHPYLGSCDVRFEGPAPLPAQVNPPIVADEARSPVGPPPGQPFNITNLKPCAYIVWLEATLRLTSGYGAVYGTFSDHVAFCKK